VAIGAEASFVARTLDSDRKHLTETLRAAAEHKGTALVEIYQNCNIFNDGAYDLIKDSDTRGDWIIPLAHGQELRFGNDNSKAVVRDPNSGDLTVAEGVAPGDPRVVVHDAHRTDPTYAFALSRLSNLDSRFSPMGVFRSVDRPVYDEQMSDQLAAAAKPGSDPDDELTKLLHGKDTWTLI
jgi:2-oxoglutarate ferredoxin oxidoreductase subunit beta